MRTWAKPDLLSKDSPWYRFLLISNILIATFFTVLSAGATIMADDAIQGDLALSDPLTTWLTTLYLLGINTAVPISGWCADRFGYKTIYGLGLALFASASFLAGLSENFPMIASARFLEGLGAGFIFPVGLATIVQNLNEKQLPFGLILYVISTFGAGFAIGLPLSGYLAQFMSWRWIFFLIFPCGIIGFLFCAFFQEDTPKVKTSPFDAKGYFPFVIFIGTLLIAVTYGPMSSTNDGWREPWILACFAIAFLCIGRTIYVESRHHDPFLPLDLFKNPVYSITCLAMFLLGMATFASVSSMMSYTIEALQYERFVSGKLGIAYGVSLAFSSIVASLLIKKLPVPVVTLTGLLILVYSYFLNNILDWQTGPGQIIPLLCIRGIGVGLSLGPATIQGMQHVPEHLKNKGAILLTFFRQVGATYGGTLIAAIAIKRKIFHVARFGEQAQTELPGYQVVFQKLYNHYSSTFANQGEESKELAKATILRNIEEQAFIQAINDALMVFGYVTLVVAIVLIVLNLRTWIKSRLP